MRAPVRQGRRRQSGEGSAQTTRGGRRLRGASGAVDGDDRLVVAVAGNDLDQERYPRGVIDAGEVVWGPQRELIQQKSVLGLPVCGGQEIELDVARSVGGDRKSNLGEGADVDGSEDFSAGRGSDYISAERQFRPPPPGPMRYMRLTLE